MSSQDLTASTHDSTHVLNPIDLIDLQASEGHHLCSLPNEAWVPILLTTCDFPPDVFQTVCLNFIKNPNINSSLLFRADILYDSLNDVSTVATSPEASQLQEALHLYHVRDGDFSGFEVKRTMIRMMVPRNPQLDKPIAQTCHILQSIRPDGLEKNLVIYIPHTSGVEQLPWYHPRVKSLAYLHTWHPHLPQSAEADNSQPSLPQAGRGDISLHYLLFPAEPRPLSERLLRTAHQLLSTLHKHGQNTLAGYTKRVHHDQVISQQRVQDTYTMLKQKHARRLCHHWVEQTDPSKHVFEDLGIAAFLIELWKDMYQGSRGTAKDDETAGARHRGFFPGFVDLGCGNGVLVDVLIREGYHGWGFDARKRKTWATFQKSVRKNLKQCILIPQPLFETHSVVNHADGGILSQVMALAQTTTGDNGEEPVWHNGIFPVGTFIISNHADELTPWTPLLASISSSPFLAIPCCSHNLSGLRFRAPSVFNSYSADSYAPSYFAPNVNKSKAVAIKTACSEMEDEQPQSGDLRELSLKARSKQPSSYASLCDWVSHLASSVGYVVEKEMLRLPSTRNMGILGRSWMPGFEEETSNSRIERVRLITDKESADGAVWVERMKGLVMSKGNLH